MCKINLRVHELVVHVPSFLSKRKFWSIFCEQIAFILSFFIACPPSPFFDVYIYSIFTFLHFHIFVSWALQNSYVPWLYMYTNKAIITIVVVVVILSGFVLKLTDILSNFMN